jgi:hypothetical protein
MHPFLAVGKAIMAVANGRTSGTLIAEPAL